MLKKRKLQAALFLLWVTLSFTACDGLLGNCRVCSLNSYENGALILTSNEAEYCDSELISIQAQPDQVIGNTTLKWECK